MIEWIPVSGSQVITAEAYDPETRRSMFVLQMVMNGGTRPAPPPTWEEFTAPGQSRGQYLNKVLKFKPNGRYGG